MTEDTDTLFDEDWYARQFAEAVERNEDWAIVYLEEITKAMKYYLNDTTLLQHRANKT